MADTYSKLLGLSDSPTPLSESEKAKIVQTPIKRQKKTHLLAKQQTSKVEKKHAAQAQIVRNESKSVSSPPTPKRNFDTSLYTTKEKTKYGTYLTDESIEKIRIHAIQTKKDDHQVVQEAVNQYFEKLGK